MNTPSFSLEFELNTAEIRKLNKMYFKDLYKERAVIVSCIALLFLILFNLSENDDFIEWMIKNLVLVIVFFTIQYLFINAICKIIFGLAKKLLKFDVFFSRYKLNFTNSFIYVHSPLGEIAHKWSKIEKAILTKDFFFLYVKESNGYIISISNKGNNGRKMEELIAFVESNVITITKV